MLTDKTVKLVTEFDGWEYPNLYPQKRTLFEGGPVITTYESWVSDGVSGYYPNQVLNLDEQKRLEELLSDNKISKNYEVVSDFIQWVNCNCPTYGDYKDCIVESWEYEYHYLGRRKSSFDGTPFDDDKWLQDPKNRVMFWDRHYKQEYFEKTLPHYVETLRQLLD